MRTTRGGIATKHGSNDKRIDHMTNAQTACQKDREKSHRLASVSKHDRHTHYDGRIKPLQNRAISPCLAADDSLNAVSAVRNDATELTSLIIEEVSEAGYAPGVVVANDAPMANGILSSRSELKIVSASLASSA